MTDCSGNENSSSVPSCRMLTVSTRVSVISRMSPCLGNPSLLRYSASSVLSPSKPLSAMASQELASPETTAVPALLEYIGSWTAPLSAVTV